MRKLAADEFEQVVAAQGHGLDSAAGPFTRVTINAANALTGVETGQIDGRVRMSPIDGMQMLKQARRDAGLTQAEVSLR